MSADRPFARGPDPRGCRATPSWVCVSGLIAMLIAGCGEPRKAGDRARSATLSRVDLFVRASGSASRRDQVLFELTRVELKDRTGHRADLKLESPQVSSRHLEHRRLIAGGDVAESAYESVVLTVRAAWVESGAHLVPLRLLPDGPESGSERGVEKADLGPANQEEAAAEVPVVVEDEVAATSVEYEVRAPVEVRRRDAVAIFLDWDVAGSLTAGEGFRPVFGARLEKAQVRLGLLYVADRASDSVLALDRSSGEVVSTGKVGRSPAALAIARDRRRLFVANGGDGSASIYDTVQNYSISTVPIQLDARCSDIASVEDLGMAAVANSALDSVSFLDVRQGARVADVRVGRRPIRMILVPRSRRLLVANHESDSVSVINTTSRNVVATLAVEAQPTDIVTDRRGREIYVGHELSPNLLVFDAESLAPLDSIRVGDQMTALLVDRRRDRIFVARSHPSEIVEVDRGLSAVIRRVPISGPVTALAQPPDGPLIYGASPVLGGLVVVNINLGREQSVLACGAAPIDVVTYD